MASSVSLSPPHLVDLAQVLGTWHAAVTPVLHDHLPRLRLWRAMLSGLSVRDRAALAQDSAVFDAACHYIPPPRAPRALDWHDGPPSERPALPPGLAEE